MSEAQEMEFRPQVRTVEDLYGPAGRLEAILNTGRVDETGGLMSPYVALVAHPHPLGGGTMHNKVVYHTAKAFSSFGMPVLRFNFRGTGLSEGSHDEGRGEVDDVKAALDWLVEKYALPVLFAGFSFGSHVGLRACCGDIRVRGVVGLGLPVRAEGRDYTYEWLRHCGAVPKLFVSGDSDQFSPQGVLEAVLVGAPEPKKIVWVAGADHFFAGAHTPNGLTTGQSPESKLGVMSEAIRSWLREEFEL